MIHLTVNFRILVNSMNVSLCGMTRDRDEVTLALRPCSGAFPGPLQEVCFIQPYKEVRSCFLTAT